MRKIFKAIYWPVLVTLSSLYTTAGAYANETTYLYTGLRHLHNAASNYYLSLRDSVIEGNTFSPNTFYAELEKAKSAFDSENLPNHIKIEATETIHLLQNSAEFVEKNGYAYPAGDEKMEESFSELRNEISSVTDNLSLNKQPYVTFDRLSHVFHNYLALQVRVGEATNPAIARDDISVLASDANSQLLKLIEMHPNDHDLLKTKTTWNFIYGPITEWREKEIVHLVSEYQKYILDSVMKKMNQ